MKNLRPPISHTGKVIRRCQIDKQCSNQAGVGNSGNDNHLYPGHQKFSAGKKGFACKHFPDQCDEKRQSDQNIKGEQCAISVYKKIIDYTRDKDPVTYDMALKIMEDEIEHEEDLEAIKEDIQVMLKSLK